MRWTTLLMLIAMMATMGCGGGEPDRDDFEQIDVEIQNAIGMKMDLQGLETTLKSEGVPGLKGELEGLVESFEESGEEPEGPHAETYKKIQTSLKELQGMANSGAARAELEKKITELQALGNKLPSKE